MIIFFKPFNLFIVFAFLVLGSIAHLMYGHCQSSKVHYILQRYYMPNYLPKWMLTGNKDELDFFKADKKYTGIWHEWWKSGTKRSETEIKDGKKTGNYISWTENGLFQFEREEKFGRQVNTTKEWYESGAKWSVAVAEGDLNNELKGKYTVWYENGKIKSEYEGKNNLKNGKGTEWYENGAIKSKIEYKDGKKNGKYIMWDEKGIKIKEENYIDDILIRVINDN